MRFIYKNEMIRFLNVIKLGTIQQLRGQEEGGGGHCVLKLCFTQTFPGNQNETLK